jgi:hypothetical protein
VAPCCRGIKKLGFTRKPVQRHQQLRREFPQVTGFYSAVWIVQRGHTKQIEAWSHAFAHAIAPRIRLYAEYHPLPAKLLAEIVLAVAEWLGFTIIQILPALHLEAEVITKRAAAIPHADGQVTLGPSARR